MATYKADGEGREVGKPSLNEMEPGRVLGAVLPLSEEARTKIRDRMELIEYFLNEERVVWT
jgi:hypothetical protein